MKSAAASVAQLKAGASPPAARPSLKAAPSGQNGSGKPAEPMFDHEKVEVYSLAREVVRAATVVLGRKMPKDLHESFDRATRSILFSVGEGAAKPTQPDRQRCYEVARGSATEAATHLDLMQLRGIISASEYAAARAPLLKVAQTLTRLCAPPRVILGTTIRP
jgi:four helix bundle protein